jgi:hypothetical protein
LERFADRYRVPPYEKLARSYLAAKIAQGLASARDGDGRRLILAKRGKDGVRYVNITACRKLPVLRHIRQRIQKDIVGQGASLEKVELQIAAVTGEPVIESGRAANLQGE